MSEKENYLHIPLGDQSVEEYGPLLRESILIAVRSVFDAIGDPDDLTRRDIESVRILLDLALKIQVAEAEHNQPVPDHKPGGK